jgi:hypothetical protein
VFTIAVGEIFSTESINFDLGGGRVGEFFNASAHAAMELLTGKVVTRLRQNNIK